MKLKVVGMVRWDSWRVWWSPCTLPEIFLVVVLWDLVHCRRCLLLVQVHLFMQRGSHISKGFGFLKISFEFYADDQLYDLGWIISWSENDKKLVLWITIIFHGSVFLYFEIGLYNTAWELPYLNKPIVWDCHFSEARFIFYFILKNIFRLKFTNFYIW